MYNDIKIEQEITKSNTYFQSLEQFCTAIGNKIF